MSIVVHIPHSSTLIPAAERSAFVLNDEALRAELLRMTDAYTDELFAPWADDVTAVVYPYSRLLVDPERFREDAEEPMAARGMGAVYTRTSHGEPLRARRGDPERLRLLTAYYDPHHRALAEAVAAKLQRHGRCLVVDAHSFRSRPLPCDVHQSPNRPDICIGTDPFHTPPALAQRAVDAFAAEGWSVAVNRPYAGALVPIEVYGVDARVSAIMVEVRRGLYMNEATGERLTNLAGIRAQLAQALSGLRLS